jgi:hypothetical protein
MEDYRTVVVQRVPAMIVMVRNRAIRSSEQWLLAITIYCDNIVNVLSSFLQAGCERGFGLACRSLFTGRLPSSPILVIPLESRSCG